jgi:hypothetical protein
MFVGFTDVCYIISASMSLSSPITLFIKKLTSFQLLLGNCAGKSMGIYYVN